MTIHFRSRIESPIKHIDKLFPNGINGCCCTAGYPYTAFDSTLGECNGLDGYFIYQPIPCSSYECPRKGVTGCCCACAFSGMTSGISECECQDLLGVWTAGDCSNQNPDVLCIRPLSSYNDYQGTDARKKNACCGVTLVGDTPQPYCETVCTPWECEDNTISGFSSNFFIGVYSCPGVQTFCSLPPQFAALTSPPKETLEDYVYGNCCLQGTKCICLENVTLKRCISLNGSFYLAEELEYDCKMCYKHCTQGEE